MDLLEAVGDTPLGQVIRRQFNADPIARGDADKVAAHLSAGLRHDLMALIQFDSKMSVRKTLDYGSFQLDRFFFRHKYLLIFLNFRTRNYTGNFLICLPQRENAGKPGFVPLKPAQ
jgi:hypothetical protein